MDGTLQACYLIKCGFVEIIEMMVTVILEANISQ